MNGFNGADPHDGHAMTAMMARMAGDHAALAARVTDIEDRLEDLAGAFDDIESVLDQPPTASAAATEPAPGLSPTTAGENDRAGGEPDIGLDMRRLVAWVRDNVALLLERKLPQTGGYPYWCRRWWMHPEAIARFEAVQRSWDEAVREPTGNAMVVYFEHLDHQLNVLCGENGPFSGCARGHTSASNPRPLGQDDPDEAYFAELQHAPTPRHTP